MDNNKYIFQIGNCGIYQLLITFILFLINIGVYIPTYFISFAQTKPFVYINSSDNSTWLSDEICLENVYLTTDLTKTNRNFLIRNDIKENTQSEDYFYCNNFYKILLFENVFFINYVFHVASLFLSSRISFSLISSIFYFILFLSSILDLSTNSIKDIMTILSSFSPYIITFSINYLTNITLTNTRSIYLNLLSNVSSNSAFLFLLLIKDFNQYDFKIIQFIFYLIVFLICFLFYFLSVDHPKYLPDNRALLVSSLSRIVSYNHCCNKKKAHNLVKNLESLVINNDLIRQDQNKRVGKIIFVLILINFIVGYLYFSSIIKIPDYFYLFSSNVIYFIFAEVVLSIFISFIWSMCPNLLKHISILSFLLINFIYNLDESHLYLFLLRKFITDNIFSLNLLQNHNFFSYLNNDKLITVNTILYLSLWQGAVMVPFSSIYLDRELNSYLFQASGVVLLVLNYFIKEKNSDNE